MTNDEAIYVLKNTAWLGSEEQEEKVFEAVRMAVVEALKQPEIMSDGTLHITVDADVSTIDRILLSQKGTHSGDIYYREEEHED